MNIPPVSKKTVLAWALLILLLAGLTRSYGITDHWKNNDHYNYGGVSTNVWLHCLNKVPFEFSLGRLVNDCDGPGEPRIYGNHSPVFLWGIWGMTKIFGDHEWAYRAWMLIFSLANVWLVFQIGLRVWPTESFKALVPMFFQAFFLSGMYFGTHTENMTELTLTPMLLSSLCALDQRMRWACFWAALAGVTGWVGFFQFGALLAYTWLSRPKSLKTVLWGILAGLVVCGLHLTYLKGQWNWLSFVVKKVTDAEYAQPKSLLDQILMPVYFATNFFVSQSRLLGPLFASWALYEFSVGGFKPIWITLWQNLRSRKWSTPNVPPVIVAAILTGLGGFLSTLPGHRIVRVHIFLYVYLMPMWAFLCAHVVLRFYQQIQNPNALIKIFEHRKVYIAISICAPAFYPFGIFQSSRIHDVFNSVFLVLMVIAFWVWFKRFENEPHEKAQDHKLLQHLGAIVLIAGATNFSQVTNYRNEPDTEFAFCEKARTEYEATGQPLKTSERRTRAKEEAYCRGIPIEYVNQ
jgi:hypothetical protein